MRTLTKPTLDRALAALTRMVERAEQRALPKRKPAKFHTPVETVEYQDKTA